MYEGRAPEGHGHSTAERSRAEQIAERAIGTSAKVANELTVKAVDDRIADNFDGGGPNVYAFARRPPASRRSPENTKSRTDESIRGSWLSDNRVSGRLVRDPDASVIRLMRHAATP
jgi:hypothetical protein